MNKKERERKRYIHLYIERERKKMEKNWKFKYKVLPFLLSVTNLRVVFSATGIYVLMVIVTFKNTRFKLDRSSGKFSPF